MGNGKLTDPAKTALTGPPLLQIIDAFMVYALLTAAVQVNARQSVSES